MAGTIFWGPVSTSSAKLKIFVYKNKSLENEGR